MPSNPFSKKENRKKHKSSSTRSEECKVLCCKKKFAKIATGILSTGLIASQCEINRINNNVLIVEPKFEAILTTVMQNKDGIPDGCSGASGYMASVAEYAMQNAVWPDFSIWESSDPCLNNFLFAFEYDNSDKLKQNWGNFNVLNHDLLELKYNVPLDQARGMDAINLTELATTTDYAPYTTAVNSIAKNLQCMLAQINNQIAWPINDDSYNFRPLISNASYVDKLDNNKVKNARIATWREICSDESTAPHSKYYLIGYSSKACKKTCSPCK